jgi:hypothetical protein
MNRSLGKWKLPQPTDLKDETQTEWRDIPRRFEKKIDA